MCQSNIKTEKEERLKRMAGRQKYHISTWGDTKTSTAVVSKNISSFTLFITQKKRKLNYFENNHKSLQQKSIAK